MPDEKEPFYKRTWFLLFAIFAGTWLAFDVVGAIWMIHDGYSLSDVP